MNEPYWASGPGEILRHGVSLLSEDSDAKRRLAMISIDNSVELMLQTFIQLPKRISGVDLSRKQRSAYCENFPSLLDGIEQCAASKITGINLGEIEWFHRLRNELYHQGNGLTVERLKVEAYAEIAKQLYASLFGEKLELDETPGMDRLGRFLADWISLEGVMREHAKDQQINPLLGFHHLKDAGLITGAEFRRLQELRKIRNSVVHGEYSPELHLTDDVLQEMKNLLRKVKG